MKKIRILSALMAMCMILSLLPVSALAVDAEHTPDCGYACTHEHDEDCGYVAEDLYGSCDCAAEADEDGNIVHDDTCASLTVVTAAAPCTHTCGDDEWVCDESCPTVEKTAVSLETETFSVANGKFNLYYYDWTSKTWIYKYNIDLSYTEGDPDSLLAAAVACDVSQEVLQELKGQDPYYYIDGAKKMDGYIRVEVRKRTVGSITATAANGTVSYKTSAMSEAVPYTAPVANDTAMTFCFTPEDGYELESAKLFQNTIELTEEDDGSYSYAIADNYLYSALTLTVSFIEKPIEKESLTLDMAKGAVSVAKNGESLLVVQGNDRYTLVGGALTLTGTMNLGGDMPKTDVVVIGSDVELDLITDQLTITGYWARKHIITIGENAMIDWTLQGGTTLFGPTANAVKLAAGADVTVKGDTLTATNDGQDYAAISVPQGATLTIDGATVNAKGGGAGIGSDTNHFSAPSETWAGTIEIINGAHVTAKGGTGAAAIGGGEYSNSGSIHIGADCIVDATAGGNGPAAIGGGERASDGRAGGKAGTIAIDAGATVTARSVSGGSAIGRGLCSDSTVISDTSGSITIEKGASVTAYALGHDNYTGDHGTPYYFAIDAGIKNDGDAPILNARFDKGALPRKAGTVIKDENGYPIGSIPAYNKLAVVGNGEETFFELPAASPASAFATTVSSAGEYMVANAADGKTAERAQYLLEDGDSQFLFTVGEELTTRDQLKFTTFTITATAGDNGTISDMGEVSVSPLDNKTYTVTPADGYVVDTVTLDGEPVEINGNTYTFENVTANHTIAVTFKTAPVIPPVTPPGTTTYTITVKYVDQDGERLADSYTTSKNAGSKYDVSAQAAKAIEGYTIDRVDGAVKADTLRSNVTVTVHYKQNTDTPNKPEIDIPEEEPPLADLPEVEIPGEDTPLTDLPMTEEETTIVATEVPMGNLPQTGTSRSVDPAVTLGLLALTGSLALAGLTVGMKKRKDSEAAE